MYIRILFCFIILLLILEIFIHNLIRECHLIVTKLNGWQVFCQMWLIKTSCHLKSCAYTLHQFSSILYSYINIKDSILNWAFSQIMSFIVIWICWPLSCFYNFQYTCYFFIKNEFFNSCHLNSSFSCTCCAL